MKRTPLKRFTPLKARSALKRGGPIRTVSAKKVKRQAIQAKVRRIVFERDDHTCRVAKVIAAHQSRVLDGVAELIAELEAPLAPACHGDLHPHHRWLSSQGGPDAVWNEITACAACHEFVHRFPAYSREMGLYSSTGQEPAFKRLTALLEGADDE